MKTPAPHLSIKLLRLFCNPNLVEDVEGDVMELFEESVRIKSKAKAKWLLWFEVLKLFRPGIIKPMEGIYKLNSYGMFKNNLTSAWRNLLKRKQFSALNILGLAIGMAACLVILQYVRFELSYDKFHPNVENLYRLNLGMRGSNSMENGIRATNHPAVAPAMKADFPEVEDFARIAKFSSYGTSMPRIGYTNENQVDKILYAENSYIADASFLTMFNYPLIAGDSKTALKDPWSAVISKTMANKLFGDKDPVGKVITSMRNYDHKITGVFKDFPQNSHLKIDVIVSLASIENQTHTWNFAEYYTYLKLRPGTDVENLQQKLGGFVDKYLGDSNKNGMVQEMYLQPVTDIHLHSNLIKEARQNGSYQAVTFLSLIAVMIMVIAWINFINLSTSRAIERASEVGIRKVAGASRLQLITQFFTESALINLFAILLALIMVQLASPYFNEVVGKVVLTDIWSSVFWLKDYNWLIFLTILIGGSLLAGIYPALILSSYQPIKTIKGNIYRSSQKLGFRYSLVILQFAISFILIAGTLVVFSQLKYMQSQGLGFNIDQMVAVKTPITNSAALRAKTEVLKEILLKESDIHHFSPSSDIPGHISETMCPFKQSGLADDESIISTYIFTDETFLPTYGIDLVAGRNFSKDISSDEDGIIINELAAKMLGYPTPEQAIGKKVEMQFVHQSFELDVIGVVKNINIQSLSHQQVPLVFRQIPKIKGGWWEFNADYYSIKIGGADVYQTVAKIEESFKKLFPDEPFNYYFLDDHFNEQYQSDRQFGNIFGIFSGLAIVVACLGLFGLVSYVSSTRTKEIGIRKVMGASIVQILTLLSRQFVKLLVIASVLAVPISWLLADSWLDNYAYRMELDSWIFMLAAIMVFAIALLTVFWQTWKTANTNPVESLRDQ